VPVHGKQSLVFHDGETIFKGLPSPLLGGRYNSLLIDAKTIPASLEVSAWTEDEVIMGVRNREHVVEGTQVHPESILTDRGHDILTNFLNLPRPSLKVRK